MDPVDPIWRDWLRDAWQRFAWANEARQQFSQLCRELGDVNAYVIRCEPSGDRWEARFHRLIEALEALQAFDDTAEGLWTLQELSREYRHRLVYPVAIWPAEDPYEVFVDGLSIPASQIEVVSHQHLADGDVVMRFAMRGATALSRVEPQVIVALGNDHPLCHGHLATTVLNRIAVEIGATMVELGEGFFT
jgi:hypothetical protein